MTYTRRGTARERILDIAEELFYNESIRAVGIDRVIADADVAKMTFYNHFHSKDELVLAYIQRRSARWHEWFGRTLARFARTNQDRPLAVFDALEERFLSPNYRGCAFVNAIVELANQSHPASQAASEHKQGVEEFICQIIAEAGYENAELLARQFMLLTEGAIAMSLRENSATPAGVAKQIAAQLLSTAPRAT